MIFRALDPNQRGPHPRELTGFTTEMVGGSLHYIRKPVEPSRFTLLMPEFPLKPLDYCPEPYDPGDYEEYTPFSTELTDYSGVD
jgi:hypothetical protein